MAETGIEQTDAISPDPLIARSRTVVPSDAVAIQAVPHADVDDPVTEPTRQVPAPRGHAGSSTVRSIAEGDA